MHESRSTVRRSRPRWLPLLAVAAVSSLLFGAEPPEEGMYVMDKPERTLEQVEAAYREMKPVAYEPPAGRWERLPKTHKRLRGGGELRVVQLGDSIVNDTSRSAWPLLVQKNHPQTVVKAWTCVRGGAGCWWYKEPGRVKRYVLDMNPDLVMIGGISQRDDLDSIRDVVRQVRAASDCDVLLLTGPFGAVDPNDPAQWAKIENRPEGDYGAKLKVLADELGPGVQFLDLQRAWGEYARASGKPVAHFKRDDVHANIHGEAILGRILERYFRESAR